MIEGYIALAKRIRQELADLEQVVARAERAITALPSITAQGRPKSGGVA